MARQVPPETAQEKAGKAIAKMNSQQLDILNSGMVFPHTVFIVGSGPNGLKHYKDIPNDAYVIALNSAINYLPRKPQMWIVADGQAPSRDWFRKALEILEHDVIRVWSDEVSEKVQSDPTYRFQLVPDFDHGFRPVPGYFRRDETVAGIGIDLAYRLETLEIVLCGIDMYGDKFADGSQAPGNMNNKRGKVWNCRNDLDIEIRWMRERGIKVMTMSETELREPVHRHNK